MELADEVQMPTPGQMRALFPGPSPEGAVVRRRSPGIIVS